MAQRYEQNDNQGRESNRDTGQQWQERNREYNRQGYPSNAESSRYGAQNDYGSQGGDRSHGSDTYTSRGYGSQFEPGSSRYQNQSFSQDGSQYGSGPYARENYGAGAGAEGRNASRQAFRDLYQEHGPSAGRADDRYSSQGRQPSDSAPYYGENLQGRGSNEYGRRSDYGAFGAQGYGGEGGFGSAGYGGQGGYARYGSHGEYGVPGGYGGDHGNRQGDFGARRSAIERQVERGSRTGFADQQVSYEQGAYGGYGQAGHGASSGQGSSSWGNWGRDENNMAGYRQRRAPKNYQRSDERLREDICERLMNRWDIDAGEVSVEVQGGMVTLEGTVQNRRERHAIEDLVDDCHGVKDIDNKIRVQGGDQGRNQSWDEAIHRDSGSGTASNQPAQSGQSSTTGARLGADTSSSAPAISASTVAKKKDQSRE